MKTFFKKVITAFKELPPTAMFLFKKTALLTLVLIVFSICTIPILDIGMSPLLLSGVVVLYSFYMMIIIIYRQMKLGYTEVKATCIEREVESNVVKKMANKNNCVFVFQDENNNVLSLTLSEKQKVREGEVCVLTFTNLPSGKLDANNLLGITACTEVPFGKAKEIKSTKCTKVPFEKAEEVKPKKRYRIKKE